jgi:hypothetical protein
MSTLSANTITPTSGNSIVINSELLIKGPGGDITLGSTGSTNLSASYADYSVTASYALNGGANTGDITFEGIKIIGAGTGSGDGNNYSTIELVPDNNLYNNDQYIVLDPTTPNHIHVRAGGAIDESNAYLFLGGEKSNVRVTDSAYQVQINTTAVDSSSFSWNFDNEGSTLFPTLTTPRGDTNSGDLTTQTLRLGNGANEAVISTPNGTAGFPNSQRLVINPGQGSGSSEGGDIYLWAGRGGVDGGTGGDVKVRGGYGPESGSGGYVRIEGGDTTHGYAGFVEIKGGNSNTAEGGTVNIHGGLGNSNAQNGNVTINTYDTIGTQKSWIFDTEGLLTIPDLLQLPVRATDPRTPVEGMIMASGSAGSSVLYYYNGTIWNALFLNK